MLDWKDLTKGLSNKNFLGVFISAKFIRFWQTISLRSYFSMKVYRRKSSICESQDCSGCCSFVIPGTLKELENVMVWLFCAVCFGFLLVLNLAVLVFVRLLLFSLFRYVCLLAAELVFA